MVPFSISGLNKYNDQAVKHDLFDEIYILSQGYKNTIDGLVRNKKKVKFYILFLVGDPVNPSLCGCVE